MASLPSANLDRCTCGSHSATASIFPLRNCSGNWLIGGSMKVNRVLPDKEVAAINKAAGVADLPRQQPQDLSKLGFGKTKVTLPPSTEQMRQALSARRSNSKA